MPNVYLSSESPDRELCACALEVFFELVRHIFANPTYNQSLAALTSGSLRGSCTVLQEGYAGLLDDTCSSPAVRRFTLVSRSPVRIVAALYWPFKSTELRTALLSNCTAH